jgi:hypothetical protein
VRGARQQTQPLPPSAVVPSPPPGTGAETPAQRLLVPGLVVVSFLLVMLLGVLVVGRLIRTAGEAPPSAAATAAPPPTAAPTPGPVVTVEETITVPLATPAPTLVSPSMEPATASPSPPPTPRPAAPRPTPKPTPRPAEASPEQLRAQQAASLVGQAETAWALQKYDEAGRRYDEALQLEAGNARAAAGKARSQWAAAATRKVFALGRTVSTPAKSGKGPAGFEAEDVALKNQDFVCEVGIEIDPPAVKPGDDYGYVASVSLVSAGKKSIKIKSLQANVTLDGAPSSESPPALVREVQKQRAAIAEIRGAWKEGMKSWRLEVIVTADKGDSCRNSVNWR